MGKNLLTRVAFGFVSIVMLALCIRYAGEPLGKTLMYGGAMLHFGLLAYNDHPVRFTSVELFHENLQNPVPLVSIILVLIALILIITGVLLEISNAMTL